MPLPKKAPFKKSERLLLCGNRCVNWHKSELVVSDSRETRSISQLYFFTLLPLIIVFFAFLHRIFYLALILFYAPVDCFCNDGSAIRR